jgi:integrase
MGRPGPVLFFEPARTAVSVRVVPAPTVVVDALAAHRATFPSESSNLHQRTRDLIRRSNCGTMWLWVTKWIGLEELGSHDLRHYRAWLVFRTGSGWERGRGAPDREPPGTGLRRPHSGGCRPTSFVVLLSSCEDISYR